MCGCATKVVTGPFMFKPVHGGLGLCLAHAFSAPCGSRCPGEVWEEFPVFDRIVYLVPRTVAPVLQHQAEVKLKQLRKAIWLQESLWERSGWCSKRCRNIWPASSWKQIRRGVLSCEAGGCNYLCRGPPRCPPQCLAKESLLAYICLNIPFTSTGFTMSVILNVLTLCVSLTSPESRRWFLGSLSGRKCCKCMWGPGHLCNKCTLMTGAPSATSGQGRNNSVMVKLPEGYPPGIGGSGLREVFNFPE